MIWAICMVASALCAPRTSHLRVFFQADRTFLADLSCAGSGSCFVKASGPRILELTARGTIRRTYSCRAKSLFAVQDEAIVVHDLAPKISVLRAGHVHPMRHRWTDQLLVSRDHRRKAAYVWDQDRIFGLHPSGRDLKPLGRLASGGLSPSSLASFDNENHVLACGPLMRNDPRGSELHVLHRGALRVFKLGSRDVTQVAYAGAERIVWRDLDGNSGLVDLKTGALRLLKLPSPATMILPLGADRLVAASQNWLYVIDVRSGRVISKADAEGLVTGLDVSADGRDIYVAEKLGTVYIMRR